jgi:uncharacterized protein YbjT (DUF2867 family)
MSSSISIVGADRVSWGYIGSKLEAERRVTESGLPWTIQRATQFYDLILAGARRAEKVPVIPVPSSMRVQPVDPDEVAARLVELALGDPAGRVPDFGGPEVTDAADLIRRYLHLTGRRRPVVPVWLPGMAKVRAGALLAEEPSVRARRRWEDFLDRKLSGA